MSRSPALTPPCPLPCPPKLQNEEELISGRSTTWLVLLATANQKEPPASPDSQSPCWALLATLHLLVGCASGEQHQSRSSCPSEINKLAQLILARALTMSNIPAAVNICSCDSDQVDHLKCPGIVTPCVSGQSGRKAQVGIGANTDCIHRVNLSECLVSNNHGSR